MLYKMLQHHAAAFVARTHAFVLPVPSARHIRSRQRLWERDIPDGAAVRQRHTAPYIFHQQWRVIQAAAALDPVTAQPELDKGFGLPLPAIRHQPRLDFHAIKQLRTESNTAAKNKELMYIQAGQQGITQTFISACMDILMKHQFLRVRLGEGSGLDRDETAKGLEMLLDCVCVHQIGFTVTLYRQAGLPRPSNCITTATTQPPAEAAAANVQGSDVPKESKGVKAASKVRAKRRSSTKTADDRPSEFQVL